MADKGVIIEFDFAAMDGAGLLFKTTKKFLKDLDGIKLDEMAEAKYLAGKDYLDGLAGLFAFVKTKKTAVKAARDFAEIFGAALEDAVVKAITPAFKNFIKALSDKNVRVVIATRADIEKVSPSFGSLLSKNVVLYRAESATYGCAKWDVWRRACAANKLRPFASVAITGSGLGVKSALLAGMPAVAVMNDHVAYQDFSGTDDVVKELSGTTAKKVLEILRID